MQTKEYRLTDICDFQGGTQPPKEEWITKPREGYARMLQIRDFTQDKAEHVGYVKDTKKLNKCEEDDVLIGRYGASVGKILTGLAGAYNVAIIKTIPNEELLSKRYLYYVLTGKDFQNFILNIGARAAQAGFNKSDLSLFKLHIPTSLEDQERIVDVLEKVTNIVKKRARSIVLLDEFLKMKFLEMFGDPVQNQKQWKIDSMNSVVKDILSGTSYGGKEKEKLSSDELGVLKISAVTQGIFNPKEFKAVKKEKITKAVIPIKKDMLLISRANTKELVAACCIIQADYPSLFLPDKLWSLIVDETKIRPIFMNFLLKNENYRNVVRKEASGGHDSMLNISMKKFRDLSLPVPDTNIQKQFEQIVKKIDSLKLFFYDQSLLLDNLKDTLSQKALKGELKIVEKAFIAGEIKLKPKISEEIIAIKKINKELEAFHRNQPHTGAPDEIDNTIRQLEAELKIKGEIPFSDDYVKYRLVIGKFKEPFTFDQLWEEITTFPFETVPEYDKFSSILFKWLGEKHAFIRQQFNESTKQIELIVNETA
ncbi:restriction endonuclease subunit S [Pedobacter nutrimenti]|uniref:restriction endonuclease subunit S n=1 Tax=Pedobacter nutrimenti TaxID=1241337 RepID=UPI002931E46A|nr:restriction endonuclease subunit S [Pedobacter nutrimenti]